MDDRAEFHIKLMSALVTELGKSQKHWLATQLAEMLASGLTATAEPDCNCSTDEAAEIAAGLIRKMGSARSMLSTRPRRASRGATPQQVEEARKAIRRKFDAWRAVNLNGNWHAAFARIMVRQHSCISTQRIVEEWARAWEMEAPQDSPKS